MNKDELEQKACIIEGCENQKWARGMCHKHLWRERHKGGTSEESLTQKRHGLHKKKSYGVWRLMRQRCYSENNSEYPRYGGRGIVMCDSWRESFENFYRDMGDKPSGLTIERIDNNLGYSPDNCKWGTKTEQSRNRRNVKLDMGLAQSIRFMAVWYGSTYKEIAEHFQISTSAVGSIVNNKIWKEGAQ